MTDPLARSILEQKRSGRGHRVQLWLIAGAIVLLAALVAVSITALRGHADRARQVQLIVAELNADTQRISAIEWQATAQRRTDRELNEEFQRIRAHTDGLLQEYLRIGAAQGRRLDAEARRYHTAIEKQLALIDDGRIAESEELEDRETKPTFARFLRRVQAVDAAEHKKGARAAARTDLGIVASLLLAALLLIVALWRLDRLRSRVARARSDDLEVQALQDALTGLPNRRKLMLDLDREILRASAERSCIVILCDLDGFKAYNDTFGHLEGDLLLGRMSDKLAGAVAPYGTAYRLGGDEFCALLHVAPEGLGLALAACHAALRETGRGFEIGASIGAVTLPEEASDSSAALRLADQRMYAQKNERGSSVKQQLRDLILRVLAEQDPDLFEHIHGVARLAGRVGRRLGFDEAHAEQLVRAAELHDVGKIAIPDSILQKPGPLDLVEQEFIRRHTLIGESILNAAPALAGVGQLVRSSHERYDGTGYPDGLRAEEIPLPSRIIFLCDAFHAMTSDRPYCRAISEQDALAELRRCAGTQFDPDVVDAFAAELRSLQTPRNSVPEEQMAEPVPAA